MNLDELEAKAKKANDSPPLSQAWLDLRMACAPVRILALVRVAQAAKSCEETVDMLSPLHLSIELNDALRALEETP